MVLRATATNSFYGCINFPYGCTYIENVWFATHTIYVNSI
jgi:hypothetical protein